MSKVKIHWQTPEPDEVDLQDYGHSKNKNWNQLTGSEKDEILDHLRENYVLTVEDIKLL